MREITQGMLDRYMRRYDTLDVHIKLPDLFGVSRRRQIRILRGSMMIFKRRRKWDPVLKLRYFVTPDGKRTYFHSTRPYTR